jgi:drug/metabolite transporter (DMT)-like permease
VAVPLLVAGLLWFGAYNLMLAAAEQQVDAGTAAMLVNVGPVRSPSSPVFFLVKGSRGRSSSDARSPSSASR